METGVFITNINGSVEDEQLRSFFNQFGHISDFNLKSDKFIETTKICYINFSTVMAAKNCVQQADKSLFFGEPLRVTFKKFLDRNPSKVNGSVAGVQSFGRGRGVLISNSEAPSFSDDAVKLIDLTIPLKKKLAVEIVELKDLSNILARPIPTTEKFQTHLQTLLKRANENIDRLKIVKDPEINGFYLARWTEDKKFYRAKVLDKLNSNEFQVCFVDEGTSGDVVSELRVIPEYLTNIPRQFLNCTLDGNNTAELIDLILEEGSQSVVNICAADSTKVDDKLVVSIFINDVDVIDVYNSKFGVESKNLLNHNSHTNCHPKNNVIKNNVVVYEQMVSKENESLWEKIAELEKRVKMLENK